MFKVSIEAASLSDLAVKVKKLSLELEVQPPQPVVSSVTAEEQSEEARGDITQVPPVLPQVKRGRPRKTEVNSDRAPHAKSVTKGKRGRPRKKVPKEPWLMDDDAVLKETEALNSKGAAPPAPKPLSPTAPLPSPVDLRKKHVKPKEEDDYPFVLEDESGNGDGSDELEELNRKQNEVVEKKGGGNGEAQKIDDLLERGEEIIHETGAKAPTKEIVLDTARKLIRAYRQKQLDPEPVLRDVLSSYQVKKVSDLKSAHWSHFIQKCHTLI